MKLAKLSASCEYLYSPKSWLHFQDDEMKLITVLAQLTYLPFVSVKNILSHVILLLLIQKSIKMPRNLKNYFRESLTVFSFFMLISIKKYNSCNLNEIYNRDILRIRLFKTKTNDDILAKQAPNGSFFYLPISTVRFIGIHLIYLFLIRYILLTTKHEDIIKNIKVKCQYSKYKIYFIIMISLQLLRTIFGEIEIIRIAYILRNINTINKKKVFFFVFTSFLKQFLVNMSMNIHGITCALYSKDIRYSTLNT